MNHQMMLGMFLGGVAMAAPPVLLTIGILIYARRQSASAAIADKVPKP